MSNKIYFYSRIQLYDLFINQFDFLDYNLKYRKLKIKQSNFNFEIEIKLIDFNTENLCKNFTELLNLQWNSSQRFNLVRKMPNNFSNYLNFKLTLRKFVLFKFLDNCFNSIFLDQSLLFFFKNKNYLTILLNQTHWNWFACHFFLASFLSKKSNVSPSKLKISFYNHADTEIIRSFSQQYWIPLKQ